MGVSESVGVSESAGVSVRVWVCREPRGGAILS